MHFIFKYFHAVMMGTSAYSWLLTFMYYPIISSTEYRHEVRPIVKKILDKTYTDVCEKDERINLVKILSDGLNKILDQNSNLAKVIELLAESNGNIFIQLLVPGARNGFYSPNNKTIFIQKNGNLLETLMHEATHKALDILYNNYCLPYLSNQDNSLNESINKDFRSLQLLHSYSFIDKAEFKNFNQDCLLDYSFSEDLIATDKNLFYRLMIAYQPHEWDAELLPHFVQHITNNILTNSNNLWGNYDSYRKTLSFMQKTLALPTQEIPNEEVEIEETLYLQLLKKYPVATSKIAKNAKELIDLMFSDNKFNIILEDSAAGKLAFMSILESVRDDYIDEIFSGKNTEHFVIKVIDLLSVADTQYKYQIIKEFCKLPDIKLKSICAKHQETLLSLSGKYQPIIVDRLTLASIDVNPIQSLSLDSSIVTEITEEKVELSGNIVAETDVVVFGSCMPWIYLGHR